MAAVEDTGFSDVAAGAWYAEAAVWCRDNGIMSGTSGTAFSPSSTMTRAMLAAVLYRALEVRQSLEAQTSPMWRRMRTTTAQQIGHPPTESFPAMETSALVPTIL
jgi:hypothetical protein